MKNFFFSLFSIYFLAFQIPCNASSGLSQLPFDQEKKYESSEEFRIESQVLKKYQAAAHLLSKSSSKTVETSLVSYETLPSGVSIHVGWYTDGNVCTALNGTEQGKQVVLLNGSIVGVSYEISGNGNYFVHNYTWGKVYSYGNRQVIKFN